MVLTSQTSSVLDTITQGKRGFIVINDRIISHYDHLKFYKNKVRGEEIEEIVLFFHKDTDSIVRTYSLSENPDDNSWLIIKGKTEHTLEECKALSKLLRMSKMVPDNRLISSVIGISFEEENEPILLPKELSYKIDEFVEEFGNDAGFESHQKAVEYIVGEFLKDPTQHMKQSVKKSRRYVWRSKTGNETLEIDISDGVATCFQCNSKDCHHIKRIYSDDEMISELRRKKINLNPKSFD